MATSQNQDKEMFQLIVVFFISFSSVKFCAFHWRKLYFKVQTFKAVGISVEISILSGMIRF